MIPRQSIVLFLRDDLLVDEEEDLPDYVEPVVSTAEFLTKFSNNRAYINKAKITYTGAEGLIGTQCLLIPRNTLIHMIWHIYDRRLW
eukprot:SAG22_NODE_17400_length_305_cov_1.470874_1_plen_86_part_01